MFTIPHSTHFEPHFRMDESARQISRSIESVSKALAEWTVSAQFESDATITDRYGEGARRRWVGDTQARISHLAQSLAVRCPELFEDSVGWMLAAQRSRGLDGSDLFLNLECLRDVVAAELPAVVTEAAVPCIERACEAIRRSPAEQSRPSPTERSQHADLSQRYLSLILEGQGERAAEIVMDAAAAGASVAELYSEVLQPAMHEVGWRWQTDQISIADEHMATVMTQMVMSRLRQFFPKRTRRGLRMLATSVAGDLHEIGVRMVADFFYIDGWDAVYLGANMPVTDMLTTLIERDVHLVALSASSVVHMTAMVEAIKSIRSSPGCERMKILVGGPPFNLVPRLWKEVGADGYARTASDAVAVGNQLVAGDAINV